jgi:hypothetical protein
VKEKKGKDPKRMHSIVLETFVVSSISGAVFSLVLVLFLVLVLQSKVIKDQMLSQANFVLSSVSSQLLAGDVFSVQRLIENQNNMNA